jgi:hypothetical protein
MGNFGADVWTLCQNTKRFASMKKIPRYRWRYRWAVVFGGFEVNQYELS